MGRVSVMHLFNDPAIIRTFAEYGHRTAIKPAEI